MWWCQNRWKLDKSKIFPTWAHLWAASSWSASFCTHLRGASRRDLCEIGDVSQIVSLHFQWLAGKLHFDNIPVLTLTLKSELTHSKLSLQSSFPVGAEVEQWTRKNQVKIPKTTGTGCHEMSSMQSIQKMHKRKKGNQKQTTLWLERTIAKARKKSEGRSREQGTVIFNHDSPSKHSGNKSVSRTISSHQSQKLCVYGGGEPMNGNAHSLSCYTHNFSDERWVDVTATIHGTTLAGPANILHSWKLKFQRRFLPIGSRDI